MLTSIGLNITKRTEFYPVATGAAAGSSIGLNLLLVPRFGVTGAAVATACSYGVLAGLSAFFAHRVYPVGYEWARMARIAVAGVGAYWIAIVVIPLGWPVLAGLAARALTAVGIYVGLLASTGFLTAGERQRVKQLSRALVARRSHQPEPKPVETEVPDTMELAGQVVSATAGEVIDDAERERRG